MRVIAFYSQKGGVGKTTSSVNIGVALAQRGRRTLLVDLDSNACASAYLGTYVDLEESAGMALLGQCPLSAVTRPVVDGLWLVPGSRDLVTLERLLDEAADVRKAVYALVEALSSLDAGAYDYVLLDCPGGQVGMGQMALMAADEIVIPTGMSIVDLYAAVPTLNQIHDAQEFRADEGRPTLLGFLPNEAGKGGVPTKLRAMLDQYNLPYFTPIRASALLRTVAMAAQLEQRCIVLSRPNCAASLSYQQVADEIDLGIEAARARAAAAQGAEETDSADGDTVPPVGDGDRVKPALAGEIWAATQMPEKALNQLTLAAEAEVAAPGIGQPAAATETAASVGNGPTADSVSAPEPIAGAEAGMAPAPTQSAVGGATVDGSGEAARDLAETDTPSGDAVLAVPASQWPVGVNAAMADTTH